MQTSAENLYLNLKERDGIWTLIQPKREAMRFADKRLALRALVEADKTARLDGVLTHILVEPDFTPRPGAQFTP